MGSDKVEQRMLMGNEAIGRGLIEYGCTLAASYPGTPASEILASAAQFMKETGVKAHIEWSVNEKVAYEVALAHSYTGKRAAVAMKQVGLNVAADPFTRSAYLGIVGGFVIIAADDPGPHSSQTEQDSRFFAQFAKVPVLDPSSPREAKEMVKEAFDLSERYELPVMLRPTTSICHARQNVACGRPEILGRQARFEKNPGRWVATPQFLYQLHSSLNDKLQRISEEEQYYPVLTRLHQKRNKRAIIASGVAFSNTFELLEDMGLADEIDLYQVRMPYPLNKRFIQGIREQYDQALVIEETYPVIEMQLAQAPETIKGRKSGFVPSQGELTPDIIEDLINRFVGRPTGQAKPAEQSRGKRPSLCAGCPHRAAFYAIRKTFPKGIFPSDIGCYTLGMNIGAVDTCHCMGACISQGAGFYHAHSQDGDEFPPIIVTIGDSTFFHAGIPGLINAVFQGARFVLVILDNDTTAMTGNQPTPQVGLRADGSRGHQVLIEDIVKSCGVGFLEVCDPYHLSAFIDLLKQADAYCRSDKGGVAVLISRRPCLMDKRADREGERRMVRVTDDCTGCRYCIERFECPALEFVALPSSEPDAKDKGRVRVIDHLCTGCGVCLSVCPKDAIVNGEVSE
jgi:indolepyruvate ferredoxin oxidoreductase, alpha subunit